jgi:hypothetical protein
MQPAPGLHQGRTGQQATDRSGHRRSGAAAQPRAWAARWPCAGPCRRPRGNFRAWCIAVVDSAMRTSGTAAAKKATPGSRLTRPTRQNVPFYPLGHE